MYQKSEFTIGWKTWVAAVLASLLLWALIAAVVVGLIALFKPRAESVVHAYTVHGADMRETVKCEFDQPLKSGAGLTVRGMKTTILHGATSTWSSLTLCMPT